MRKAKYVRDEPMGRAKLCCGNSIVGECLDKKQVRCPPNYLKGTVCRVDVSPVHLNQIIHLDKDVYVREGNTTVKLDGRDLTDWVQQRAQAGGKGDGE